jgi:hypothetical protein
LIQNISTCLKRERPAASVIQAGAKGRGQLEEWRDWQTPVLQANVPNRNAAMKAKWRGGSCRGRLSTAVPMLLPQDPLLCAS